MDMLNESRLTSLLHKALRARQSFINPEHTSAFRLFNGFYEGEPDLVVDVYGSTLVLFSYSEDGQASLLLTQLARDVLLEALPWIKCVISKYHGAEDTDLRMGNITFGSLPQTQISENGVNYAIDLMMNQDASFYLDTRNLRRWLIEQTAGLEILNTFAYTGSLGVAALAGGAANVVQMDRNQKFLELARRSAMLNRLDLGKMKLTVVDFFVGIGQLKQKGRLFDLVILDPPFFSITDKGKVDQVEESARLINKVRPLVRDGGSIVAINNALFLSGDEYMRSLAMLGQAGYVKVEEVILVPGDITGFEETVENQPPSNPAPFNHPTKIAVLRIKRKS
ncbi:MAG: hypothetical protein FD147_2020 [Chloroflexi bacterium]|nr:MAG: hypothetical protein FD147_2020 [Chloroflexota bacterium]